ISSFRRPVGAPPAPKRRNQEPSRLHPAEVQLKSGETYRILSLHGVWAWSILFAGKDIENRSWSTPHRGRILIHSSSHKSAGRSLAAERALIAECSGIPIDEVPKDFPRS